jgi:hypothetical protein
VAGRLFARLYSSGELRLAGELVEVDGGLVFDGIDDYIQTASSNVFKVQEHTLECWIKAKDYDAYRGIVEIAYGGVGQSRLMTFGDEIRYHPGYATVPNSFIRLTNLPINEYIHLAATWDGEVATAYLNGEIIGQISLETTFTYSITPFVYIGRDNYDDRYFNGVIRDVRIWSVARTQEQIQEGMYKELTGNEPGLIGYWRLNSSSGGIARDTTGYANHGTIYGAQWVIFDDADGFQLGARALKVDELVESAQLSSEAGSVSMRLSSDGTLYLGGELYELVPIA